MSRVNCDTAHRVALSPQAPYLSPQMRKTAFSRGPWHTKKQTRTFTLIRKPTQTLSICHGGWKHACAHKPRSSDVNVQKIKRFIIYLLFFFFLPHPPVIFIPSQCMLLHQIDIKEGPVCVCWLSFQSRMCTWPLADRVDKWQCFLMRAKRAGQPHTSMMRSSICNIIYLSHWFLILALAHTPTRQHEKDDASNLPPQPDNSILDSAPFGRDN